MKPFIRFIIFFFIVCNINMACNPNNNQIIPEGNLPNIIVKVKDSSGVFRVTEQYYLYPDSNHVFFDSIRIIKANSDYTVSFDFKNYISKNYIIIKYNNLLDSSNAEILKFNSRKVSTYIKYYNLINDNDLSGEIVDFNTLDSILYAVTTRQGTPDQNLYHFSLDAFSADSMHVASLNTETFATNFEYTSYFSNKQNNTNSLLLSGFIPTDFNNIPFFGSYIPFPKLNMRLVSSIKNFGILSSDIVYTFDGNGRVKTATLNNSTLIEYNY